MTQHLSSCPKQKIHKYPWVSTSLYYWLVIETSSSYRPFLKSVSLTPQNKLTWLALKTSMNESMYLLYQTWWFSSDRQLGFRGFVDFDYLWESAVFCWNPSCCSVDVFNVFFLVGGWVPTHLKNMIVKVDHETPGIGVNMKKYLKFHHLVFHEEKTQTVLYEKNRLTVPQDLSIRHRGRSKNLSLNSWDYMTPRWKKQGGLVGLLGIPKEVQADQTLPIGGRGFFT